MWEKPISMRRFFKKLKSQRHCPKKLILALTRFRTSRWRPTCLSPISKLLKNTIVTGRLVRQAECEPQSRIRLRLWFSGKRTVAALDLSTGHRRARRRSNAHAKPQVILKTLATNALNFLKWISGYKSLTLKVALRVAKSNGACFGLDPN